MKKASSKKLEKERETVYLGRLYLIPSHPNVHHGTPYHSTDADSETLSPAQ